MPEGTYPLPTASTPAARPAAEHSLPLLSCLPHLLSVLEIFSHACDVSLLPGFSGHSLLRDPRHNKGLSFTEKERDAHYLRGLLPPVVLSQDLQVCCFLLLVCLCTFGS